MKRLLQVVAAIGLALMCVSACSSRVYANGDKKTQDANALFARANTLEDLEAPDTPPYLLRIRVVGVGQLAGYPEGSYEVHFASSLEFRYDWTFGEVHSAAGANGDTKKEWGTVETTPVGALHAVFGRAMSYAYAGTALGPRTTKLKVSRRVENGLTMDCAEQREPVYNEVCFDTTTAAVLAALDTPGFEYQYSDFRSWGTHLVPGAIIVFAANAPILEAKIELLEALPNDQSQPSNFAPPPGATIQQLGKSCSIESLRLIDGIRPDYPRSAGSPKNNGTVALWGQVNTAGHFSDVIVVQSAGPAFDQAALDAVRRWKYSPERICGQPVQIQTNVVVNF
jgi:TonB family protein